MTPGKYGCRFPIAHAPYEIMSYGSDGQEEGSGTASDISNPQILLHGPEGRFVSLLLQMLTAEANLRVGSRLVIK